MSRVLPVLFALVMSGALPACGPSTPSAPRPAGSECRSTIQCEEGLLCEADWYTNGGVCTRPCETGECGEGARCVSLGVRGVDGEWLFRCMNDCTRERGSRGGCAPGFACDRDGICRLGCGGLAECASGLTCEVESSRCLSAGSGLTGEPCESPAQCAGPSASCVEGRCVRTDCDLGGERACGAGETCELLPDERGAGGETRVPSCVATR